MTRLLVPHGVTPGPRRFSKFLSPQDQIVFFFLGQSKEEVIHKLLRSSQKLIHVGHPEGEPLHDMVMALKLEFKQFKKRVNERKENLKKHLSFCEQGKEVDITIVNRITHGLEAYIQNNGSHY